MRKFALFVAAIPLILTPPALAGTDKHEDEAEKAESVCRPRTSS